MEKTNIIAPLGNLSYDMNGKTEIGNDIFIEKIPIHLTEMIHDLIT